MHIDLWKKSVWEGHVLYNFNNMTFQKRQKNEYGKKKKSVVAKGKGEVKDE